MSIWPPILYIILTAIGIGSEMVQHGKPKTGNHNAVATIIATAFVMFLLYWGGFFIPLFGIEK